MPHSEDIERVRQAIMRFRELLDIMRSNLEDSEALYTSLFSAFTAEEIANTRQKDMQGKAALQMIGDISPLSRAVNHVYFDVHEMERAFDELQGIIGTIQNSNNSPDSN